MTVLERSRVCQSVTALRVESVTAPVLPPDFHLPTAEEIERMHDEMRRAGFEEGRAAGHAEGLEAGRAEGYAEGRAQAEAEAARLAGLADSLDEALRELDGEIAEQLMALAIEMARRMVRLTLAENPEAILETVRSALLQLPQGHAHIQLHPEVIIEATLVDAPPATEPLDAIGSPPEIPIER